MDINILNSNDDDWEIRLLGAIIKKAIDDYSDINHKDHESAKKFLFDNVGEYTNKGKPKNGLDFWLSYLDIDGDSIRRLLKKI